MKRCVIIGGAPIGRYDRILPLLQPDDFYIFCDCGLRHRQGLGVEPHLIVGDFDSHPDPHLPVETVTLPVEKDDTDTMYAARLGAQRGFKEFLLLGAAGDRLDHTLGNVAILSWLHQQGLEAELADDWSRMEMVSQKAVDIEGSYSYFSLLCVAGPAEGICIRGAKYPLENATLTPDYPLGVSNQVAEEKATVQVEKGSLLLIKVY